MGRGGDCSRGGGVNIIDEFTVFLFTHLLLTGDIFLLVYAIDNIDSFKEVQRLRDAIIETKQITYKTGKIIVPMVVAGNKSDLEEDREILEVSWGSVPN